LAGIVVVSSNSFTTRLSRFRAMSNNPTTTEFEELLDHVREGSQDAAWELIETFGEHIQRVISRMLDHRMRGQFDSTDFVQAVWISFLREPEQIQSFETPDDVMKFLTVIARHKVIEGGRRWLISQKSGVKRPVSIDDPHLNPDILASKREPTPSAVAVARERWNRIISREAPHFKEVVRLRLAGASFVEIANELQLHERTVRKIVDRLVTLPAF
jgi:RNA polymerase sigma factor (sigma-70 family)